MKYASALFNAYLKNKQKICLFSQKEPQNLI